MVQDANIRLVQGNACTHLLHDSLLVCRHGCCLRNLLQLLLDLHLRNRRRLLRGSRLEHLHKNTVNKGCD